VNISKCKFFKKDLRFLGYIIDDGKLKADPEKLLAISEFPVPDKPKKLRRFLGMAGWYRMLIPNFSIVTGPLTDCLKLGNNKQFKWTPEAQKSFDLLKQALQSPPVLTHPDFGKMFYVQTDACKSGIGAVLFQKDDNDEEHPIAYMSKKFNTTQSKWSTTEQECYAVIEGIQKFRPYIEGLPFTVITDHSSLQWLINHKDAHGKLFRWCLKLQPFEFDIEHRKGSQNVVADTLSRAFDLDELHCQTPDIDLDSPYFLSAEYNELKDTIRQNQERLPDLQVSENFIYKRTLFRKGDPNDDLHIWKLYLPKELTKIAIEAAHNPPEAGHCGMHKTLHKLRTKYYWPKMPIEVYEYVRNCQICKKSKPANYILRPPMAKKPIEERPFQKLYLDFLGPYPRSKLGHTSLLVILDSFSKFVFIKPLRKANANSVINYLIESVFCTFGVPETIFSDNGKQFLSKEFQDCLEAYGIEHKKTPNYSPQSNTSERVNASILAAIRSYIGNKEHRTWDTNIPQITAALRSTVHEAIKFSPYFVLFGQHMTTHGTNYQLLRKLDALGENEAEILEPADFLTLIRN